MGILDRGQKLAPTPESIGELRARCITIRLENFLDLYQVVQDMKPLSEVLRNVSADVQQVMPQFSSLLENLNEVVNEALLETKIDTSQPGLEDILNVRSQAGGEILREVSGIVENSLHESFPEPPLAITSNRAEVIACGFERSSSKEDDWGELSDEVVKIIDKLESKNRIKIEEVVA